MQLAEDFEQFCLTPDGGRVVGCHMAAVVEAAISECKDHSVKAFREKEVWIRKVEELKAEDAQLSAVASGLRRAAHAGALATEDVQSELQVAFRRREALVEETTANRKASAAFAVQLQQLRPEIAEADERCARLETSLVQKSKALRAAACWTCRPRGRAAPKAVAAAGSGFSDGGSVGAAFYGQVRRAGDESEGPAAERPHEPGDAEPGLRLRLRVSALSGGRSLQPRSPPGADQQLATDESNGSEEFSSSDDMHCGSFWARLPYAPRSRADQSSRSRRTQDTLMFGNLFHK
eukprot:s1215_g10.t1